MSSAFQNAGSQYAGSNTNITITLLNIHIITIMLWRMWQACLKHSYWLNIYLWKPENGTEDREWIAANGLCNHVKFELMSCKLSGNVLSRNQPCNNAYSQRNSPVVFLTKHAVFTKKEWTFKKITIKIVLFMITI